MCFSFLSAPTVLAEGETKGQVDWGGVLGSPAEVEPAVDESLHNGALVLCNPDSLKLLDSDSTAPMQQDGEASTGAVDLKICTFETHSGDVTEVHKDNICSGKKSHGKTNMRIYRICVLQYEIK